MTCAHCGTDIAYKALICYRCGRATTEPRVKPPASGSLLAAPTRRRTPWLAIVIALILLGLGLWILVQRPQEDAGVLIPRFETARLDCQPVARDLGGAKASPEEGRCGRGLSPVGWRVVRNSGSDRPFER